MTLRTLILPVVIAACACLAPETSAQNTPVKKFRLPQFNAEGFRTSFLTGEEALMVSAERIDVKEMHFSSFSGDEKNTLLTTLLAPQATVRILEKNHIVVEGESSVRLVRDEVDATGTDWSYDHSNKRLLIRKNVHVVYRAVLKDILK